MSSIDLSIFLFNESIHPSLYFCASPPRQQRWGLIKPQFTAPPSGHGCDQQAGGGGIHEKYGQESARGANTGSGVKQYSIRNVSRLLCATMKQVKPPVL